MASPSFLSFACGIYGTVEWTCVLYCDLNKITLCCGRISATSTLCGESVFANLAAWCVITGANDMVGSG